MRSRLLIFISLLFPVLSFGQSYTYDEAGNRTVVKENDWTTMTRYYIGGRYERDEAVRDTVKRLYFGGDAYSAPMVLCKFFRKEGDLLFAQKLFLLVSSTKKSGIYLYGTDKFSPKTIPADHEVMGNIFTAEVFRKGMIVMRK